MRARILESALRKRLGTMPAVVLLGSRQVGKTTLARTIGSEQGALYLDCESPADRSKLYDPETYFTDRFGTLIILDEVHRVPELFPILRGMIDEARRRGIRNNMYLLLGSASIDLLDRSAESLAGRVSYLELHPLSLMEMNISGSSDRDALWLRGGYPDSVLADSDEVSFHWRLDFIRTYLEREVPLFAPRKSAEQMRQLWTMLAHLQGQVYNASLLARSIGTDYKTTQSYVDLLQQLLLIRMVQPWHANVGKRLTKRPKVYVRDSGILHTLLGIQTHEDLVGNPIVGMSWEGFVLQQISAINSNNVSVWFYRTSGGAEIDILLQFNNGDLWALEVKKSVIPTPRRGFYEAIKDVKPQRALVVYTGNETYNISPDVQAIPLEVLLQEIIHRTTQPAL